MKSLHINQDNDWATAPPLEEAEIVLKRVYFEKLAQLQVEMHKARATSIDTKLDRYFHSSQIKYTLARVLCLSSYDNKPVSITEISKQIYASRQATLGMLNDCVAENWAILTSGSPNKYQASQVLIEAFELYCDFQIEVVQSIGMDAAHVALVNYQKIIRDNLYSTK